MKGWLAAIILGLAFISPASHASNGKVVLKGLLREKYPELENTLKKGIDDVSGVQGAGGGFFPFAEIDLNGDRVPELLVAYESSYFGGSAGTYPVEIFTPQSTGGWRWLGQVWGRENRPLIIGPLIIGKRTQGWATIRFEKHLYCWKDLQDGEPPPEKGYAGHLPQGGLYVYCNKQQP